MSYFSEHKRGFWGTVIFHGIILLLLIIFGFITPLPLPEEEGILVNFGNTNQGRGLREPAPRKQTPPPVAKEKKQVEVKKETTPPPPPKSKPAPPKPAKQEVMTQDFEKTAAIESAKKKKREEERKRKEELDRKRKIEEQQRQERLEKERQEELERQRLAEIERKRQEELERQRKAEEERKRQEEAERLRKEQEQKRISEINNRAANAFGSGGAGTIDSKSTGQGVTYPGGNQGNPNGSANSNNYGNGGGAGNGVSFNLSGRSALSLPKPYYPGNEEGIVVVKVTVNKYGKVTNAEPGARGSTTYNAQLVAAAKQAALKAKFNLDENAPAFQQGTITYRFVLD